MSNPEITTILGKGSAFDGKLTFEGAVRIDGEFSGEITTTGTLIVGESAEVKAEISASTIIIEGVVRGDIHASNLIEIHAPARVYGNLASPSLEIQKGSLFQGNCRMDDAAEHSAPLRNGKSQRSKGEAQPQPAAEKAEV
jgi:cytoskeletal protein CcmA (bactofilin family)